ncbi:MAG: peptidylprolyl isomerase [Gammaproteobacteria bacterium]
MNSRTKALWCAVAATTVVACAPVEAPKKVLAGPSAGTLNGETIPQSAVDIFLSGQFRKDASELTDDERTRGRDGFVQMMALAQEAQRLGLQDGADVQGQIYVQEMSTLARALITQKTEDDPIDEAKVREAYEAQLNSGSAREYKARHILVETEEEAKSLIEKLDGGADFVELAKSDSTGPSGPNGGDLGWFGQGRMVEPFFNATVELESGNYTTAPVQTRFGWHVILLEQTRDRPFAESSEQLRAELQREWVENYVETLKSGATVSWNEATGADPITE